MWSAAAFLLLQAHQALGQSVASTEGMIGSSINSREPCLDDTCLYKPARTSNSTEDKEANHHGIGQSSDFSTFDNLESQEFPEECQLYMAKSSIPNAGIGIFTATDLREDEVVGEGEMLIPLTDIMFTDHWLLDDVQWDTSLDLRLYFESHYSNSIYYPGFGAQINCHMGLNNVEHTLPKYDAANLHRSADPGVGAFTNWYAMKNRVKRDVKAGEELFASYGDSWFVNRQEIMGEIPLSQDFPVADEMVRKLSKLVPSDGQSGEALQYVLDMFRSLLPPRTANAVPSKWQDLKIAAEHGTARHSLGGPSSIKTKEWLQEHGACIDHIYVKTSPIPQAGRGAFAKRNLREGEVVVPAPVLQILREQTILYEPVDSDPQSHEPGEPKGIQLLRNYAWGHPRSSMMFVPYSPNVNFINHASKEKANVKIQWSRNPINRVDWFDQPVEDVVLNGFGLMMEVVALRDIDPHEEILLDYGDKWQNAWDHHVEFWKPTEGSEEYVPAEDMKEGLIRTETEQRRNPYPRNIDTACYFSTTPETEYTDEFNDFFFNWDESNFECMRFCRIVSRRTNVTDGKTFYSVKLRPDSTSSLPEGCALPDGETIYVRNVPAHSVKLVDKKFSRDQHLPNAFRHEIGLPLDLFPSAWLDDPDLLPEDEKFIYQGSTQDGME